MNNFRFVIELLLFFHEPGSKLYWYLMVLPDLYMGPLEIVTNSKFLKDFKFQYFAMIGE